MSGARSDAAAILVQQPGPAERLFERLPLLSVERIGPELGEALVDQLVVVALGLDGPVIPWRRRVNRQRQREQEPEQADRPDPLALHPVHGSVGRRRTKVGEGLPRRFAHWRHAVIVAGEWASRAVKPRVRGTTHDQADRFPAPRVEARLEAWVAGSRGFVKLRGLRGISRVDLPTHEPTVGPRCRSTATVAPSAVLRKSTSRS